MKVQPWPYDNITFVKSVLNEYNFQITDYDFNLYRYNGDELYDCCFKIEPLYANIVITLIYDGEILYVESLLDNASKYPERIINVCIFLLGYLR